MSVNDSVEEFDALPETATALLIRVSAEQTEQLPGVIAVIEAELENFETLRPYHFTTNPEEYNRYWAIRSGIFPSVGAQRPVGTSCLIEDVAFHLEQLPEATADLRAILEQVGYSEAVI